jgi:glycosyltransferase involved in cell wall biosynthesis
MAPSVTAILLTYNCASFVRAALRSMLEQDLAECMEAIVSDDASTDDTFEVVQEELADYRGPHLVRVRQRAANSGSKSAHLNEVLPEATGEVIVSFDGDDISERRRVRRIKEAFRNNSAAQAVFSSLSLIDSQGRSRGAGRVPHPGPSQAPSEWFARVDTFAAGSTLAIRRPVVEAFGPLEAEIPEDVVLPFRASLLGEVVYIDEPLVRFRRYAGSLTADMGRYASMEDFRARYLLGIERARRNMRSRLDDLARAEQLMPFKAAEFASLRTTVSDSLRVAEMTAPLVDASFVTRAMALLRLLRSGAYRDELLQHIGLALAPKCYLRYKRRSFGVPSREERRPLHIATIATAMHETAAAFASLAENII